MQEKYLVAVKICKKTEIFGFETEEESNQFCSVLDSHNVQYARAINKEGIHDQNRNKDKASLWTETLVHTRRILSGLRADVNKSGNDKS